MSKSVVKDKSFDFAVRIVKLCRYLREEKKEFVLSKQLVKSGTSIGANISEAQRGHTKPDFYAKMAIALKEASETEYWIRLLHATEYINDKEFSSLHSGINELISLLVSICNSNNKTQTN